jgi:hypothetical protein
MGKKRQHLSILLFREGRNGKGTASEAAEKVSIRIRVCLQAYRKLQKISPALAAEVALYWQAMSFFRNLFSRAIRNRNGFRLQPLGVHSIPSRETLQHGDRPDL